MIHLDTTADLTAPISAEELELLAQLLGPDADAAAEAPPLKRRQRDRAPLSFGQEQLWFLQQLTGGATAYNAPVALRLDGPLDAAALQQSLSAIVRRHEALRTTFDLADGQPIQLIQPASPVALPLIDLRAADGLEADEAIQRLAQDEAERPFDLQHGPLLRTTLLRIAPEQHVLLLVIHHIASDDWSLGILYRELAALYPAYAAGRAAHLPELPLQYADYACWQRDWLQDDMLAAQLSYWREQLAGAPTELTLPADRPRPPVQTFNGATQSFTLTGATSAAIQQLSQRARVTPFMTLLAVWQALLARLSRQDEVVVGTPVASRPSAELDDLIGFFLNTLALRTNVVDNPSFNQFLQRVRTVTLEAFDHQALPFAKLVEAVQPERRLSASPVFQALFTLHNAPLAPLTLPGLRVTPAPLRLRTAKFDLSLAIEETADGMLGVLEYNTDLFDAATITRMIRQFETLLEHVLADPDRPVLDAPLIADDERTQMLALNAATASYPQQRCLHELFEAQAARSPQAIAVVYEQERLSYGELNRRANQLAHHLRARGVGRGALVGLCVERSLELVVGLLAILKAGGAYVPLDPSYPPERLAAMIEDAGLALALGQERVRNGLTAYQDRLVCLDRDWPSIAECSSANIDGAAQPDDLAYIIYTSGSTGQPKGVMVSHANVGRLFAATQSWFHFDEHDVWTLFHSFAFDFSVWELWGALLHGGRLVVTPYEVSRSPQAFYMLLASEGVTVLNQTPSAFRQLIQAETSVVGTTDLHLRYIIFGGEALELDSVGRWFDRHGDQQPQLVNMYGITETTVHVTYRPLSIADVRAEPGSVIGRAIPDLELYVLDAQLQPVPIGVAGELYVGGDGVARGYLGRPALTAERFIPNPFLKAQDAGFIPHPSASRLYKTGDLARYLPNGDLEYLGRIDQQVKLRGFRIELGEIEAALRQHPALREATVLAREDTPGDRQLVAYLVARGAPPTVSELRSLLQRTLPDHMTPAAFVFLAALPLTTNGKLDRNALPKPDAARPALEQPFRAPRTPEQELLARIWSETLKIERVGIHDNFFALGGDSIRSVRVLALAKEQGLDLSLQQLFRCQTIAELTQELRPASKQPAPSPQTAPFSLISTADRQLLPADVEDAYPLTRLQLGMIYHAQFRTDAPDYHNTSGYHLKAPLDVELLRKAAQQVVARHAVLRTSFDLTSYSEPLQLVHRAATLEVEEQDLRHLSFREQEQAIQRFVERESRRLFDLARPPLLRFHIHRRSDDSFQFMITEFHPILDGWSLNTVIAQTFQLHFAWLRQEPQPEEAPLSSTFRDYVLLERQALESAECQCFWAERLSDATMTQLPGRPAPIEEQAQQRIQKLDVPITPAVSSSLQQLARAASVPLKSVLLAAHLRVLSLVSGQTDVLTGAVTNGRPEERDGTRVCGLFLNTLPFRAQLHGGSWRDLIRQTFEAELEIMPFRRYPLAALQRQWSGGGRLFDVDFNYVDFHVFNDLFKAGKAEFLGFTVAWEPKETPLSVAFSADRLSGAITLRLEYHAARFGDEQMQAFADYYTAVMREMACDPDARYETAQLLPERERRSMLVEHNATERRYPQPERLHELFEAQAARSPQAIAVISEQERLRYAELNARANQLAHHLRACGVGPDVLVGICVERSVELVVGLLGILKAGGAYVPLDPEYPAERLRFMIQDARAPVLLTQARLRATLPDTAARIICLDRDWPQIEQAGVAEPVSDGDPDNLAYMIYTSGSTGRPKGAMNTHAAIINRLLWMQETYGLEAGDRVLQKTPFSFDVSVWEFFWPLITGAQLVMARPGGHHDQRYLASTIAEQRITTLHFVPSMLQLFLTEQGDAQFPALRRVICSGEALPAEVARRFCERNTAELHNLYGPTEAAVDVTFWPCQQHDLPTVPIGRPVANTQIYIVDAQLQPTPIGVPGELLIGGVQLARGYHRRPSLTAERFIPNPFLKAEGGRRKDESGGFIPHPSSFRLYRTGDLACWRSDGAIEYLGRIDQQVKLHGVRIELGEIEAALLEQPAVREAVVLVREDTPGDQRLVAYVTYENLGAEHDAPGAQLTASPSPAQLRAALQAKLPSSMLPTAFMTLDALPLTPNGKLDRKALPKPDGASMAPTQPYVAPRTLTEQTLAAIWSYVLGLEQVGIDQNFFDLGGDSFLNMQSVARASRVGLYLTPQLLQQHPTIAELAAVVRTQQTTVAEQGIVEGALPLMPNQRMVFGAHNPDRHIWNIAALYEVQPALDPALLEQAVHALLVHHDALRICSICDESGWRQFIAPPTVTPFSYFDIAALPRAEQRAEVEAAVDRLQRSFNLATGPLLHVALFNLGPHTPNRLLMLVHHSICDRYGVELLWEDVQTAYQQAQRGQQIQLPPKTTSIKYYAERLHQHTQAGGQDHELSYWMSDARRQAPELPRDYEGGRHTGANAQTLVRGLSVDETRRLQQMASTSSDTQVLDLLLTALTQTFVAWTGSDKLLIDLLHHGRESIFDDVDLSRTLGWLIYYVPMLLELPAPASASAALATIKRQLRTMPNHGIGHGMLRYLHSDDAVREQLGSLPQPEALFNYRGTLIDRTQTAAFTTRIAQEALGQSDSLRTQRKHLLVFDLQIQAGRLQLELTYSTEVHAAATAEALADQFIYAIQELIRSAT
jgi:amino acid adenylation domain-containing protein/non-ribosomal peptide synthase protein (TIGR01720 family)